MEAYKDSVLCMNPRGFHNMVFDVYGDGFSIVCAHGVTRNKSDFFELACSLSENFEVICPDFVGRGESSYLDPMFYNYAQYMQDIVALLAKNCLDEIFWVGTSMGGILGMMLASLPKSPIKALVLNDIGMKIEKEPLNYLQKYFCEDVVFRYFSEAEAYFRKILTQFGSISDAGWERLVKHSVVPGRGGFVPAFDPNIAQVFVKFFNDVDLTVFWDTIKCPVLVLRGENSEILSQETLKIMSKRPNTKVVELKNCGHAPSLKNPDQIEIINSWFKGLVK